MVKKVSDQPTVYYSYTKPSFTNTVLPCKFAETILQREKQTVSQEGSLAVANLACLSVTVSPHVVAGHGAEYVSSPGESVLHGRLKNSE